MSKKTRPNKKRALTPKQKAFVEFYCGEAKFNATRAAILAGYSEKTAAKIGSENLIKPDVQVAIAAFMEEATERALITTEDIVRGLKSEAEYFGVDCSHAARVSAYKALTDYTGGFDNNRTKIDNTVKVNGADDSEW